MHEVGSTWARRHGVTLETMFRYVPKSNDPAALRGSGWAWSCTSGPSSCSSRARSSRVCTAAATRFREYTCFHGSGHAFMRGYHGLLPRPSSPASHSGRASRRTAPRGVPRLLDLAQRRRRHQAARRRRHQPGRSARATPSRARAGTGSSGNASSPRPSPTRATSVRLCRGVAGASGRMHRRRVAPARPRRRPDRPRARLRPALGKRRAELPAGRQRPGPRRQPLRADPAARTCAGQPQSTRNGCYALVRAHAERGHNGRFERSGCGQLQISEARAACVAGARKLGEPLGRTLSPKGRGSSRPIRRD